MTAIAVVVSLSLNGMIGYGIDNDKNDMINELIKSGKFTEDEAKDFVSKTVPNGDDSDNNGQDNNDVNDNNNQTQTKEPKGFFESKAFSIKDLKAEYHDGDYEISGTIKNISNDTITGAAITVVFYNSEESVQTVVQPIQYAFEPERKYSFEPGQEYSFTISPYRIGLELDHYKISIMQIGR
jgi:polyhydroxyalkanoate synthesis regulator phasin